MSAENLLVIINDILDFSKIEAGKLDLEETALNVQGVAEDVGRILAESAHSKGIELLVDVHPDVPTMLIGDRVRIQQVLLNLGANAVKFTSEGEVVIRISLLSETLQRVALRFDVVDMGIGIAEEDQKRLFRAFAQADSSTTRKFGGTGLGLAICRQLVELMGGQLGLVSAPGEGSTFWFELSLGRPERAGPQRAKATRRAWRGSVRWSSMTTPPTAGSCANSCGRGESSPSRPKTGIRPWGRPRPPRSRATHSTSA